jgi:hypothetical protein
MHEKLINGKKNCILRNDFQTRFNAVAPHKMTMLRLERKFFSISNVKDRKRSAQPSKCQKSANVTASPLRSLKKSFQK